MRRIWIELACVCTWVTAASAAAQPPAATPVSPPQRNVRQASLFADVHARAVGDILTVAIVERTSAQNTSTITTSRSTEFDTQGEAGTGALDFIPELGMSAGTSRDHSGSGQMSREGRLTARLAVVVAEVLPNGDLVVRGEREVQVNGEKDILQLSGTIRPADIRAGNLVYSTDIAGAKILSKGKGEITNGTRPNVLARILGWIF